MLQKKRQGAELYGRFPCDYVLWARLREKHSSAPSALSQRATKGAAAMVVVFDRW